MWVGMIPPIETESDMPVSESIAHTLYEWIKLLRQNFRMLMRQSTATLPLSDFILEKLGNSADLFFYAASLVLFSEKRAYYPASDERRAHLEEESLTEESELEAHQAEDDEFTGHVRYFGLQQLRSFVAYLADRLH